MKSIANTYIRIHNRYVSSVFPLAGTDNALVTKAMPIHNINDKCHIRKKATGKL